MCVRRRGTAVASHAPRWYRARRDAADRVVVGREPRVDPARDGVVEAIALHGAGVWVLMAAL